MAPTIICTCCNRSYESLSMVRCCICKKHFRNTCVDLSSAEVRTLNSNKGYDWSCRSCRSIGNDIKDLKALILKLQEDITDLKADISRNESSRISDDLFEELVVEVSERAKRKNNVMLFKVAEQQQSMSASDRVERDKQVVSDVLRSVAPDMELDNIKILRLGKFVAGKDRPIRATLTGESKVFGIIKNAKKLQSTKYKNISLSFDRTVRQSQAYKRTKELLEHRRENGEENLIIKYKNGIPTIVSKSLVN